jgi:hypothetical protein
MTTMCAPGQHGSVRCSHCAFNRKLVAQFQIFGLNSVLFHCFISRHEDYGLFC